MLRGFPSGCGAGLFTEYLVPGRQEDGHQEIVRAAEVQFRFQLENRVVVVLTTNGLVWVDHHLCFRESKTHCTFSEESYVRARTLLSSNIGGS